MSSQLRKHKRAARRQADRALGHKVYIFQGLWEEMLNVCADHNNQMAAMKGPPGTESLTPIDPLTMLHSVLSQACAEYWQEKQKRTTPKPAKDALVQVAPGTVLNQLKAEEKKRVVR